jgi:hypothetical protein
MQREKHEEINQSREFAEKNSNLLATYLFQKEKQKRLQYQILIIGD